MKKSISSYVGVQARLPVLFYVIKHGSDWVAFDTGNPELTAKDAAAAIGKDRADRYRPTMKPEDEFQVQIKKLGYYTGKALAPFPMYE